MRRTILSCFNTRMCVYHDPCFVGSARYRFVGLLTDSMQARGHMFKRGQKRAIRCGDTNVMTEGGNAGHPCAHRIFANSTDRNQPGIRIGNGIVKARRETFRTIRNAG